MPVFNGYLSAMREDLRLTYGIDIDDITEEALRTEIRVWALGLFTESAEVVEEFQWKNWKHSDRLITKASFVVEEAVDVLHFLAHLLNAAGIDDDMLNEAFEFKRLENRRRQEDGYAYGGLPTDR